MRWVAKIGERTDVHRVSERMPLGSRPLGRLRRRWEDNLFSVS
jgi:hypothetical protein